MTWRLFQRSPRPTPGLLICWEDSGLRVKPYLWLWFITAKISKQNQAKTTGNYANLSKSALPVESHEKQLNPQQREVMTTWVNAFYWGNSLETQHPGFGGVVCGHISTLFLACSKNLDSQKEKQVFGKKKKHCLHKLSRQNEPLY